jgi:hypothetical protein
MQANAENQNKYEKLISTIKTESSEECRILLGNWDDKTKRIVLPMADAQGYTAIHHAVSRSLHRVLAVLLDSVPKQDEISCTTATSPDMLSSTPCTPTSLVNMADSQGLTPLHHAAQAGCVDCGMVKHPSRCLRATPRRVTIIIAQALLRHRSKATAQDLMGRNPMHYACAEVRPYAPALLFRPRGSDGLWQKALRRVRGAESEEGRRAAGGMAFSSDQYPLTSRTGVA